MLKKRKKREIQRKEKYSILSYLVHGFLSLMNCGGGVRLLLMGNIHSLLCTVVVSAMIPESCSLGVSAINAKAQ